ncbi:MAG TPA: Asp-tRNA(Asn)/Glu-tRNA(Gln) amidotransferase subunit GatC [Methylomirabilota bacterium]|jgi:aspartyl-tRNA(Asn)/glutamyl-tRNA(Gln) amidotransferase subunit C|nr:Asp-tRNA(Asn)/Glu-tRNA(Gln) amidotransferase subunit GatC [Methylomirabilota bacterium]
MRIARETVQRVALLARVELSPTEERELLDHFDRILLYMEKLNDLDTTTIEPTAHAIDVPGPLRDDVVTNHPDTAALLANAPAREDDFFKAPKIIE